MVPGALFVGWKNKSTFLKTFNKNNNTGSQSINQSIDRSIYQTNASCITHVILVGFQNFGKVFCADGWEFRDFPLQIVTMPVTFVMRLHHVQRRKFHTAPGKQIGWLIGKKHNQPINQSINQSIQRETNQTNKNRWFVVCFRFPPDSNNGKLVLSTEHRKRLKFFYLRAAGINRGDHGCHFRCYVTKRRPGSPVKGDWGGGLNNDSKQSHGFLSTVLRISQVTNDVSEREFSHNLFSVGRELSISQYRAVRRHGYISNQLAVTVTPEHRSQLKPKPQQTNFSRFRNFVTPLL